MMKCPRCGYRNIREIKDWWTCPNCHYARQEASAFQDPDMLFRETCPACQGDGREDSGGFDPQGHPISLGTCPRCDGDRTILDRAAINARISGLQNTMDYAAPEVCVHLQSQIAQLLALLE